MPKETTRRRKNGDDERPSTADDETAESAPAREHPLRSEHGLEHTQGGATTRDDATDLGVPMLPGDPREPVGPEDALGPGPKRGDYSDRVGDSNYRPHQVVAVDDAEPGEPTVRVIDQRPRASQQGEVPRRKGGVETEEDE